ncbi:MFS transporter [Alicyclobacillus sp. SO9]|uniref:MFS transporter n=1 Tax=Alicyclobacillus sp. SO9 TaxID=2665646 RepID=UPI0018E83F05|nr:MFS transporter [Alicyclobacillus sp. SO9]QQE78325.1 MFS transporter [Alicyclobacillus sp. SO9]
MSNVSNTSVQRTALVIAFLGTVSVLVVGQMYVVIPLFKPMGMAFHHRASDMVITSSTFGIPYAFAGLVAGPLADAWGARKIIILSLITTGVSTLTVAFAPSFTGLATLRGIQGITAGLLSAPVFSYIAHELHKDTRIFATTVVMAAAMSSAVLMQLFGQVINGLLGWRSVFFITAPLIFLLVFVADRLLVRTSDASHQPVAAAFTSLPGLLIQWRRLALYIAALTLLSGFVAVLSGIALYGPVQLRSDPLRLFILRASALPVMGAVPFLGLRLGKLSLPIRIASGLALAASALSVMSLAAQHIWVVTIGLSVCVAGVLIAAPAIVQSIVRSAANKSGAAVSIYTFSIFLGASAGPQIAVFVASAGFSGLLVSVALLFLGGAILGSIGAIELQSSRSRRRNGA